MLFFFPRGVLDEILNLIESASEGFPFYFFYLFNWMRWKLLASNDISKWEFQFMDRTLAKGSKE